MTLNARHRQRSRNRLRWLVPAALVGGIIAGGYLASRIRRFLGGALEGYPAPAQSGVVMTGSVSTTVTLDYDAGTATKTYNHAPPIVRLLYRLAFQAPFPYTTNRASLEAARHQRTIVGLLTRHWFGRNLVAPILDVRDEPDGRLSLVSELVPGGPPTDLEQAKALTHDLTTHFLEAGLAPWQVGDYNPRAIGNLIETADGELHMIDLESNFVTPFLPRAALARALRRGQYPAFDDIDLPRLRDYIATQRPALRLSLGDQGLEELDAAVDAYERAAHEWHDREPRLVPRVLRFAFALVDPQRRRVQRAA